MNTEYNKKNMEILANIWNKSTDNSMICPQCGKNLVLIQMEQIYNVNDDYNPYSTIIECNSCTFNIKAESFTILGGIKDFDLHNIEISSWSHSGSRVLSKYEHILNYSLLSKIKDSRELVEFLIVNNQVIQIIG